MEEKNKEPIKALDPKEPIKKEEKIIYGEFYNLVLFDKDLNIKQVFSFSNRNLKDNIFSEELFYIELEFELYFEIKQLLNFNKLKFTKNPIKEKIGIGDIEKTPLPPKPPTPEEITNKALLDQTIEIGGLNQKTQGLATGIMEGVINQSTLEKKVNVLSKALLEITMKGMK